ncbi:MAG: YeeE/YedE family protein [Erythrobacter sp.]|uniref:YeeE/YedE thiosulfate transporter family protein n=1 Tax=Erythrobacter sp. TaxID=1042 RepID=UPI0025DF3DC4|nr:YeeE/YedE thiosulfate transporter family protein [Erythrobacter sp.]MCM0000663.1 YeeE/YedE family protein [Erythrobacter sp.]
MTVAITTALMFLIGYASQRAGVCMVRAMREVIDRRRVHRLAGFTLAAAAAMVVMGLAEWLGADPFMTLQGTPPDSLAVAGGVLFGLGSILAGNCAMGLLAGLTQGELWRAGAIAAMFVAALLLGPSMSSAALMLPARTPVASPLTGHVVLALTLGGTVGAGAATYLYRRLGWHRLRGGWSPLVAMGVIGTASGLLFALDRQWVYTSRIAEIAYGGSWAPGALFGLAALIAGMTAATVIGGTFRLRAGSASQWLSALPGGLLMGAGATLVPGGNDAMLFTGVPLLLPNLLAGYASFAATLALALLIRRQAVPMGA